MSVPIYVINRAGDSDRLARFAASAAALSLDFQRIEAIDGHDPAAPLFLYRDLLRPTFWGKAEIKPGAFACLLSHMAAWRRVIADGVEAALIAEDDATLIASPADALQAARMMEGLDILFVNARLKAWRGAAGGAGNAMPAAEVVELMAKAGGAPGKDGAARAPGADGYIVTAAGAARLLAHIHRVGVIAGVDWLMLGGGIAGGLAAAPDWFEMQVLAAGGALGGLDVRIAHQALTETSGGFASAIHHAEVVPIATLTENGQGAVRLTPDGLDDPVSAAFAAGTLHEAPALELMARWMPRGGTFVDIGAHVGGHTLFMLHHGGAARAVVLEHHKKAIRLLKNNLALNGVEDRVELAHLGYGIAEEIGRRVARRSGVPYQSRLKQHFAENVPVRAADSLLRDEEPALIKIDIGGEEKEALKGLRKTLNRKSPLVAIDLSFERSLKAIPFIERKGYGLAEEVRWTDEEGPRRFAIFRRLPRDESAGVDERVDAAEDALVD